MSPTKDQIRKLASTLQRSSRRGHGRNQYLLQSMNRDHSQGLLILWMLRFAEARRTYLNSHRRIIQSDSVTLIASALRDDCSASSHSLGILRHDIHTTYHSKSSANALNQRKRRRRSISTGVLAYIQVPLFSNIDPPQGLAAWLKPLGLRNEWQQICQVGAHHRCLLRFHLEP